MSMSSSPKNAVVSPFDHPAADIVIRSSDGGEFRMLKVDLSRSSHVFETMFSLPQPPNTNHSDGNIDKDGLPVVVLTETHDVLDTLLRLCMPRPRPLEEKFEDLVEVMEAARKYEMEWAFSTLEASLLELAEGEPMRTYVVACRFHHRPVAKRAALYCLRRPITELAVTDIVGLSTITGEDFRNLLAYRKNCWDTVNEYLSSWSLIGNGQVPSWWRICPDYGCAERTSVTRRDRTGFPLTVTRWWDEYVIKITKDLEECTWEGTVRIEDALGLYALHRTSCRSCTPCETVIQELPIFLAKTRSTIADRIQAVRHNMYQSVWRY